MKKAPMSVIVHFPVERHVYKYLQESVGEKMVVSKKNIFGNLVLDMMQKHDHDNKVISGELTYCVEISEDYMNRYGIQINEKIKKKFNAYIDKMFRKEMMTHIIIVSRKSVKSREPALREFLFHYNIDEEDIKFETLVKYMKREIKKSLVKVSPKK